MIFERQRILIFDKDIIQIKTEQQHLEKIISTLQRRHSPTGITRLTRNSKLFKTIVNAIHDKKGEAVVSLDLRKIDEAVADFFVLCEANSSIQLKAIADHVIEQVQEKTGEKPYHCAYSDQWILVDYVNIVTHIFRPEQRAFYDLESLWEDAGRMEHNG